MSRQENIIEKYVDKISTHDDFQNPLEKATWEFKDALSWLKEDTEKQEEISKTQNAIKDFLSTNWLFSDFQKILKRQLLLMPEEGKEKIDEAKKIIQNTDSESDAVNQLNEQLKDMGISGLDTTTQTTTEETETPENNTSYIYSLSETENQKMNDLLIKSQSPNTIDYLKNTTYLKYLNNIESELSLPKDTLQSVCFAESTWKLYSGHELIGSHAWAQWLFQFMPSTADYYMGYQKLEEKYGKIFNNRESFLKDPLATAWAAWIMLSDSMKNYGFDLPSSLAWYNRWPWNIQKIWWKINKTNFSRLPKETQAYVKKICKSILKFNWKKQPTQINKIILETNKLIAPEKKEKTDSTEILAKKRSEFGGIWNSIMTWFQGYYEKRAFKNMNWVEGKTTRTHPDIKKYLDQGLSYEESVNKYIEDNVKTQKIKSFVLYFWANTTNNQQTLKDIEIRWKTLQKFNIQPVLSTCIWSNNYSWLKELNSEIREIWKTNNYPVIDFAAKENEIAMWSNDHPNWQWYNTMENIILSA